MNLSSVSDDATKASEWPTWCFQIYLQTVECAFIFCLFRLVSMPKTTQNTFCVSLRSHADQLSTYYLRWHRHSEFCTYCELGLPRASERCATLYPRIETIEQSVALSTTIAAAAAAAIFAHRLSLKPEWRCIGDGVVQNIHVHRFDSYCCRRDVVPRNWIL